MTCERNMREMLDQEGKREGGRRKGECEDGVKAGLVGGQWLGAREAALYFRTDLAFISHDMQPRSSTVALTLLDLVMTKIMNTG